MNNLEKILNIKPTYVTDTDKENVAEANQELIEKVEENQAIVFDPKDVRFNTDFESVRDNLNDTIKETKSTLKILTLIAKDSEKASHFTALGQITKVLLDANRQLLELYEIKKKYNEENQDNSNNVSIGNMNAVFTGTTKDLKKFLDNKD